MSAGRAERREALAARAADRARRLRARALRRTTASRSPLRPHVGVASLPVLEQGDDDGARRRHRPATGACAATRCLPHVERCRTTSSTSAHYRATTTSGSSGRKGLFVFDQAGWAGPSGCSSTSARSPEPARGSRACPLAVIGGASAAHMSRRGRADPRRRHGSDAGAAGDAAEMPKLVDALNPLLGRPPQRVPGDGACCWPRSSSRVAYACGCAPCRRAASCAPRRCRPHRRGVRRGALDLYGRPTACGPATASATTASTSEDGVIAENVDADGDPVPDGEPGARLLVTNLANRVQPLIRLEVADAVP